MFAEGKRESKNEKDEMKWKLIKKVHVQGEL